MEPLMEDGCADDLLADGERIRTARLLLRPWALDDARAALAVYGTEEVSSWLAPAVERVPDIASMREHLRIWVVECVSLDSCQGRWAVVLRATGEVVGGVTLLPLPPYDIDLQIGWQIAPGAWGNGFAAEAGHGVAHFAFGAGLDEIFAVVRPHNVRGAATARRVGMEWVGRTKKYYDLELDVYRFRRGDLDVPELNVTQTAPTKSRRSGRIMMNNQSLFPDDASPGRPTVGQVMTPPTTIEPDAHLAAAAYLLEHSHGSALVVVTDDTHEPVAVITDSEITRAVAHGRSLDSTRVSEVVTTMPVTVRADVAVEDAARLMLSQRLRHLLVVEGRRLVGMVELAALCRASLAPFSAAAGTS